MLKSSKENWFHRLVQEIQEQDGPISDSDLIESMKVFRKMRSSDIVFDGQYPTLSSIENWPHSKDSKAKLFDADFLLSFMNHHFPNTKSDTIDELNNQICYNDHIWRNRSNIIRTLSQETARRGGAIKRPKRDSVWEFKSKYIDERYSGYYILLRLDNNENLKCELFCIESNIELPINTKNLKSRIDSVVTRSVINIIWGCEGELWIGDLIIGRNKFAGIALRDNIEQIPEPVTLSVLRHGRDYEESIKFIDRPVLSGVMVGWNSKNDNELFRSMFALEKIKDESMLPANRDNFFRLMESGGWKSLSEKVEKNKWKYKKEIIAAFKKSDYKIHKHACSEIIQETCIGPINLCQWIE